MRQFIVALTSWFVVCSVATAQNTSSTEPSFPWNPGETPTQFWIARSKGRCRDVQGQGGVWRARPVLSTGTEWLCSYAWLGPNTPPDLVALRRVVGDRIESDLPIVTPNSADPERDLAWFEPLYALTRARLGVPKSREPHKLGGAVRVAVLDTAADTPSGYVDPAGHGRAVGRVVEELACGDLTGCGTHVSLLPALPFSSRPDHTLRWQPQDAGALGTRGILAAAIEQASSTSQNARRLVINLSLGWSGCWERDPTTADRFDKLLTAKRDLGSQAVLTALGRAACRGALIVAAAGNGDLRSGCPEKPASPGAPRHMFPGLWGGTRLEPAMCRALGVAPTFDEPRPLLIGVGAVDDIDQQLAITDHEADLVAYSQGIVVPDATQPSGWTQPLSGTSMSAAALSGIAAALWSYDPALGVPKLLDIIRTSTVPLRAAPGAADPAARDFVCNQLWSGAGCSDVQRLSLCAALGPHASGCSTPDAAKESSAAFQTMSPIADAVQVVDCDACGSTCPEACEIAEDTSPLDGPWVIPQPKPDGCKTCAFVPLPAGLPPLFQGEFLYSIGSPVLLVKRPGYSDPLRYALLTPLVPALLPMTWLLPSAAATGTSAVLVYRASATMARESGDVLVQSVPPFNVASTVLGGP
ncbi:MAG TPA: S8/S53 family peptidase [Polyangiales bacterium]|nr:S8/S53 family peptidase [Polyangiales bacterium]